MSQGELFPNAPETVLALCRRLEARVLSIGPELSAQDCDRLIGELFLVDVTMNGISNRIRLGVDWQRRQQLDALAAERPLAAPIPVQRHWRARKLPITYSPLISKRGEVPMSPAPEGWFRGKRATRAHYHAGSSRSICGKAFVPMLVPEQLLTAAPEGTIPCGDCERMNARRREGLALIGGAR